MRTSPQANARLGGLLATALGALALLALPGIAAAKDRNHDRIPDRWEKRHHLSLKVNQARRDQDGDHLRNLAEFKAGDNPRDADTDNDGVTDGEENAGTIASFDTDSGKLTISLFGTETVSGLVTDQNPDQGARPGETPRRLERQPGQRHSGPATRPGGPRHREPGDDQRSRRRAGRRQRRRQLRPRTTQGTTTTGSAPTARPPTWSSARSSRRPSSRSSTAPRPSTRSSSARRLRGYLAASQSGPTPTSTSSGGSSW